MHTFFSVASHCLACAKEAEARGYAKRLVLACLLHDGTETYLLKEATNLATSKSRKALISKASSKKS